MKKNKAWMHLLSIYFLILTVQTANSQCNITGPVITGSTVDVYCNGSNDGSISVDVTGDNPPFNYQWCNGQTTQTATGMPAGSCCVVVTDGIGCTETACFAISEPSQIYVEVIAVQEPSSGGNDGSIGTVVGGGTGPYNYQWSDGQATADIAGLSPGTYCLTVTDVNGCTEVTCITLSSQSIEVQIIGPDQLCVNECGQYFAENIGNTQICSYVWYYGGMTIGTSDFIDFCPPNAGGDYLDLIVMDCNTGVEEIFTQYVEVVNNFPLEIVSTSPASCLDNGGNATCDKTCANSTITYTVPGSQGMDLEWEVVGAQNYQVDNNLVTVTWGNPGVGEIGVHTGPTGGFILNCTVLSVAGPWGTVAVFVDGKNGPYSYAWCNGDNGDVTSFPTGTCAVTVTDGDGNTDVCQVTMPAPEQGCEQGGPAIYNVQIMDLSCSFGTGGSINFDVNGTAPFDYQWSNGMSGQNANNLLPGLHCVTVTDGNGCSVTSCFTVQGISEMFINSYVINQLTDPGASNGAVGVQVFGGTPFYDYVWYDANGTPLGNQSSIDNLPSGEYCVVVTDANGCSVTDCLDVFVDPTQNCPLNSYITITSFPTSCYSADGGLLAHGTGGATPYTYEWVDLTNNSANVNGLSFGTHCVVITDVDGCVITECIDLPCDENVASQCSGEGSLCIDIIPEPDAVINSVPAAVNGLIELCKGETVLLQNESTEAEYYVWEMGDGYSTSAEEVAYAYDESGLYTVLLIARNECFCIDTVTTKILVSDAEIPEIICTGTTCSNNEQTYTTTATCNNFVWQLSANGTVVNGGAINDDFITVDWGSGPIGEVSLQVSNCSSAYCDKPTVEQIPIITDATPIEGPDRICPGEVSIYSLPLWTGTSYNWTVANGGEIKSGQFTNSILVEWDFELDANDPLWVAAEYENCFLGCSGQSSKNVAITPEFYLTGSIEACENSSSQYMAKDALQDNPVLCNWQVFDPNGGVLWAAGSVTNIDVSWPLSPGKYTLTASPVNPDDFCNNNYTIYVNVNAAPPALTAIDGQNTICPGEFYTYSAVANQGNVSYHWEVVGGTPTEYSGDAINVQWGNSPPFELTITQISTNGLACESLPYTMAVNPVSDINLAGPGAICVEETSIYTANAIGNGTYDWEINPSNAGTLLSGQGSEEVEILWHSVGTATVSLSLCGATENLAVNVSGFPEPNVLHPDELCPGTTGPVSATASYSSYSWRNESGSQVSASASPNLGPGYYELIVTNSIGCSGQVSFEIDALPAPEVSISNPSWNFYCEIAGVLIPTLSALNTDEGYTYQWFHNGTPLNVFSSSYTPSGPGSYYVAITDINGCTANSNIITLIETCGSDGTCTNLPGKESCPDVTNVFMTGDACNHGLFQNTSTGYIPGTVEWTFGDPASGNNSSTDEMPEHYFSRAGLFNVVMLVTDPSGDVCVLNKPFEVPVQANFDANFSCPGIMTEFEDISTFTPGTTITDWDWEFGDPASGVDNTSVLEQPGHVYNDIGTYDVTLTVTAQTGCTSTVTKSISVLPPPTGSFVVPLNSCEATALSFQTTLSSDVTTTSWDFDDPASGDANTATSANTYHAFSASGIFDVELTVQNIYGCSNTFILPVAVDANNLTGDITMAPASPICDGNSTTATAPPGATSWTWSTNQTTENITTAEAGVYEVTVSDDFGCTYSPDPGVLDIIANPDGTIKVTEYNEFGQPADCFFDGYILCEGEDVFLSISGAGDYSYVWSNNEVGDEVIYDDEHGNLLNAGTHDFTVTITDNVSGCTNVEGPYTIIVNPVPTDIQIATSPPGPICEETEATFSVSNPESDLTYLWNTGEYGTSITASTAGEYFVRGISSFGCEGESNTIEIHRSPDANLIPDGCHTHCAPDTICLPEMPDVINYQWYLDDTPISAPLGTVADYLPQTSGSYRVELFDIHGCYAASDPFELTLLPFNEETLELGACSGNTVTYAGEVLSPGSVTEFHFQNEWGCDSMITVTVTEDLLYEANETLTTCTGTQVAYNGVFYDAGDAVDLNYTTQFGCDSIIHLNVTGLPVYDELETFSTCTGTTITYGGEILSPGSITVFPMVTEHGCDSTVTVEVLEDLAYSEIVNLTGCIGEMVTYEGVDYPVGTQETFNYTTTAGCDSIIELNIASNPVYAMTEALSACEGSQAVFAGILLDVGTDTMFQLLSEYGCDSTIQVTVTGMASFDEEVPLMVCEGSMATYEGVDYPIGTDEEFLFTTAEGCDSTIHLTVGSLPIYSMQEIYSACTGTTITYGGEILSPGSITVFPMVTAQGCDSTVTVEVLEDLAYSETVNLAGCAGEMVTYEGVDYPVGTQETFDYTTTAGCDSTIMLNIASSPVYAMTEALEACEGSQAVFAGVLLNIGADTMFQFVSEYGCDSTIQVTVAGVATFEEEVPLMVCEGSMATYEGVDYPIGTDEEFLFTTAEGCDSTIHLTVGSLPVYSMQEIYSACTGTTITYGGEILSPGSITVFPMVTAQGCDSTVTVEVLEDLAYSETVNLAGCAGEMVTYEGVDYPVGTQETFDYATIAGCDSTIMLNIASSPVYAMTEALEACEGSQAVFAGVLLNIGADTMFQFVSEYGCDSTIQVTVAGVATFEEEVPLMVCEGSMATYEGVDYPIGTDEEFLFTTAEGCDSTIHLTVGSLPVYSMQEIYSACTGTTITYGGEILSPGSITVFPMVTEQGCDSTVTVEVLEDLAYSETVNLAGCAGEMVTYEGVDYPVGTQETFDYTTTAGCDSTIMLNIASSPVYAMTEALETCEGSQAVFAGVLLNIGTDTMFQFVSEYGCDSTIQVMVTGVSAFEEEVPLMVCEGSMATYEGVDYPIGTDEEFIFTSAQGCDSTIHLTVGALPVYSMQEIYSACTGTTITYGGEILSPGSITVFPMVTAQGCDSTVTVEVLEDLAYSETVNLAGCAGEMVTYEGVDYPVGTQETFDYSTTAGCDSTIMLNIASSPVYAMTEALETCEGSQAVFAGILLNIGTDTMFQLVSEYGCDSTIQVTVTGVSAFEEEVPLMVCEGSMATYEGVDYPIGTDEEFIFTSAQGCDSTIHLTVGALPVYSMQEIYSACTGTTITYGGEILSPGSITVFPMVTEQGCDSTVTVEVLEDLAYDETIELSGCEGTSVVYEGVSYPVGTTEIFNFTTVAGCDSNIVLTVAALPLSDNSVQLYACPGTTVEYNGDDLLPGSTTDYIFPNQFGCDSLVQVAVSALPTSFEEINLAGCEGSTVSVGGIDYPTGTQTDLTYINQWGCDSIISINIAALPVLITSISLEICSGETTEFDDTELFPGSVTEFIYLASNGCDSIVIVEVSAYPEFDFALSSTGIACWNTEAGEIVVENIIGGVEPFSYKVNNNGFQGDTLFGQLAPGNHTVFVQDGNGCVEEQEITIPEIPSLELGFIAPSLNCADDSIMLQAQLLNGFTDSMTYAWQHGLDGAVIPIYDPGLYTVAVSNQCETRSFETEVILGDREGDGYFYIPNAFSPNGDGSNDIFRAYAAGDIEVLVYELHLFDRWGNSLYKTEEIVNGWNGLFLAEAMNPGVYVWWLRAEVLVCGRRVVKVFEKGDVTILK